MSNTVYQNFVIENKIADMLDTQIDMNAYLTPDRSLSEAPGMIKKIHTYTATGDVEDLAMGQGNSGNIEVTFSEASYEVEVTQGNFKYYDEQFMQDPMVLETGLKGMSAKMANDLTAKAVAEFDKASLGIVGAQFTFDNFADAIALYPYEDETPLFALANPAQLATIRKKLGTQLSYSEDFVRTGYVGHVCGVPLVVSKAVPEGKIFIADKQAVTCFIKKGVEIEQERDADHRQNTVIGRKVMVVALTDATRVVSMDSATYTKTEDVAIDSSKTYYVEAAGGAFQKVATPKVADIGDYYEKN